MGASRCFRLLGLGDGAFPDIRRDTRIKEVRPARRTVCRTARFLAFTASPLFEDVNADLPGLRFAGPVA